MRFTGITCIGLLALVVFTTSAPARASDTLDLRTLESRLRQTSAISFFTKLSLKSQVDELIAQLGRFHDGHDTSALPTLRDRFDGLMGKVLSLLERRDDPLARQVEASRETLWSLLANPRTFPAMREQARLSL